MRRSFYLFVSLLLLASCGKKESFENSDEEKKKVCDAIGAKALLERGAIVQRPSLPVIETKVKEFSKIKFSSGASLVGGINILSLQRAGLFRVLKENLPNWNMAAIGMALMGLPPGSVAETLTFETSFSPKGMDFANARIHLMGNFSATDVLDKLKLLHKSGRVSLKLTERKNGLTAAYDKYSINADPVGDHILAVGYGTPGTGSIDSNPVYGLMKKNIPDNTTFWFIVMAPPQVEGLPKVIRKNIQEIQYISGYINIDASKKLECQIRIRFKTSDTALSTKELVRLAASRGLNRLGPIINKSFNLDDSQNRNIVSRGPLLRILFKLDRFQTNYLLRRLGRVLRENAQLIPVLGGSQPDASTTTGTESGDATLGSRVTGDGSAVGARLPGVTPPLAPKSTAVAPPLPVKTPLPAAKKSPSQ